jgi:UDP-glucose 4-epimerase
MNNWLITGGAGFIGQHLTEKLLSSNKKFNIVIVDNLSNHGNIYPEDSSSRSSRRKLNKYIDRDSLKFFKEDIRDKEALAKIIKEQNIDICVHLAARVSIPDSIRDPDGTIDTNVRGTGCLLEACSANRLKTFIFASSAAVYGRIQALPVSEKHAPEPLSVYGASKVAGEALVSAYGNTKRIKNAISLRIFNVYGRNQTSRYAGVVTRFASRLSKGMPPIIYGDGKQTRDFVSIDDVVNSIIAASKLSERGEDQRKKEKITEHYKRFSSNSTCHNTFNIGSGVPTAIYSLAVTMIKIYGANFQPLFRNKKSSGEIKYIYSDISKAKRFLGFKPEENVKRGIKNMLNL